MSSVIRIAKKWAPHIYASFAAIIFLDSLRFKFTNAPETQVIFTRLDGWAADLGAAGLFAQTGLFSQYVIGSAELLASALLLAGFFPRFTRLRIIGALIGLAVMTGAINFHLWTPLGIDPNQDGGGLFAAAVIVWCSSLAFLAAYRGTLANMAHEIWAAIAPAPASGN
jgi:uncharacterized membrane protein YphA (DoxX/SURF4 family)